MDKFNEDTHEFIPSRRERFQLHWRKYKSVYITGGVCLVVGAAVGIATYSYLRPNQSPVQVVIGKDNVVTQTTVLLSRDNPSKAVRCIDTGEIFASQNRAADLLNLSSSDLSKHLNGKKPHVKGMTFERIEA